MKLRTFAQSISAVLMSLCFAGFMAVPVSGGPAPTARVDMKIVSGGIVIGGTGGSGTLTFNGQAYPIKIGGLSVGLTLGFKAAEVVGEVYNLQKPSDISGTYFSAGASGTLIAGAAVTVMVNGKGVEVRLRMVQVGLGYSLDLGGMNIILK